MSRKKIDALDRIKAKTVYIEDCWIYTGDPNIRYYDPPRAKIDGERISVPRYIFERFVEQLRGDNIPCHTCDNPRCWNVKHIYQGTHFSNNYDKRSRGRTNIPKGMDHYKTVLTMNQVIEIKIRLKKGGQPLPIAKRMKLDVSLVRHISAKQSWSHITI